MKRQMRGNGFFLILILIPILLLYLSGTMGTNQLNRYNTSDLVRDISEKKVSSVTISQDQNTPAGKVQVKYRDSDNTEVYYSTDVSEVENKLYELSQNPEYRDSFN